MSEPDARQALQALDQMPQPIQRTPQADDDPGVFLTLAIQRGASADTIERMMVVRRELMAERAKKEFDAAMAAFQSECPVIVKTKAVLQKNSTTVRYKYAPLDLIVTKVRPLLQKHGFSYTMDTQTGEKGSVLAICRITHTGGHSTQSQFAVPIDPESYMNNQQKAASALTFAKRYAFLNGFGILTGDTDDDGAGAGNQPDPEKVKAALRKELWGLLKPVRLDSKTWDGPARQWLVDEADLDPATPVQELDVEPLQALLKRATERLRKLKIIP